MAAGADRHSQPIEVMYYEQGLFPPTKDSTHVLVFIVISERYLSKIHGRYETHLADTYRVM